MWKRHPSGAFFPQEKICGVINLCTHEWLYLCRGSVCMRHSHIQTDGCSAVVYNTMVCLSHFPPERTTRVLISERWFVYGRDGRGSESGPSPWWMHTPACGGSRSTTLPHVSLSLPLSDPSGICLDSCEYHFTDALEMTMI